MDAAPYNAVGVGIGSPLIAVRVYAALFTAAGADADLIYCS